MVSLLLLAALAQRYQMEGRGSGLAAGETSTAPKLPHVGLPADYFNLGLTRKTFKEELSHSPSFNSLN